MDDILKRKLENNIWKTYLHEILAGMFFSVPIMVLFWQENGLDLFQIMILQSIFAVMVVILEIPTGYFADICGRKMALVLSGFFFALAITIYSMGCNFLHFLLGETCFAFSASLGSGTWSAFIYDTLIDLQREKQYKRIWGNVLFFGMVALAFSNVLGGLIAKINLRSTLYASIPFFSLLIPMTLWLHEPHRHKPLITKGYTRELFDTIRTSVLHNAKIGWLIIYSGIVYGFNQAALWLYQPYFKFTHLDIVYFGLVFASFQLIAALASKYAHSFEERLGQKYSLMLLILLTSVSYILMSNFIFLFSFSFCFLQQFVRGFSGPVITDHINKLTKSTIRATVLSVQSLAGRLFYASVIPIIGWIADVYTLPQALTVLAITTSVSGIVLIITLHKMKII